MSTKRLSLSFLAFFPLSAWVFLSLGGCDGSVPCQSNTNCTNNNQVCYQGRCASPCKSDGDCLGDDRCENTSGRCLPPSQSQVEKSPTEALTEASPLDASPDTIQTETSPTETPLSETPTQENVSETLPETPCGNAQIDSSEECDGTNLNNQTCQSKGFTGGSLTCNPQCKFDTSACTGSPSPKPFGQICQKKEDCENGLLCVVAEDGDPGYCAATCSDTQPCPSTPPGATCALKVGEQSICGWKCTLGANDCPSGLYCTPLGSSSYCTASPQPICGNSQVEKGEECDSTNLNNQTCQGLGFSGGTLRCNGCAFDTSACTGTPPTSNFGKPCPSSGCGAGLVCIQFDTNLSICTAYCDANTPCPTAPAGASCRFTIQGSNKQICGWATDSGAPPTCGNGQTEYGEDCDGTSVLATCKGLGYTGGTLSCNSSCKYDTSACTGQTLCTNLPPQHCNSPNCGQIIAFSPTAGNGYIALHGSAFSWLRRDAVTFIKHATAAVSCVFPNTPALGLGDMSMQNGQTPAQNGQLRHPQGTHVDGTDIDLAYYQTNTANNHLRAVCEHHTNGQDQYHCVSQPNILEPKRTAFFLAKILESGRVRVIGVDGKVGPLLLTAIDQLTRDGILSPAAQQLFKSGTITWEETDTGRGWFQFHHHHAHISFRQ